MTAPRVWAEPVAIGVIALGFAIGAMTHASDFWFYGWAPYRFGPPLLNGFWNALIVFDIAVLGLLISGWRRPALVLAVIVMLCDVAANFYAWRVLGLSDFALSLIPQAAFLGFLLGAVGFLWRWKGPEDS